jgi:hypothetical protein
MITNALTVPHVPVKADPPRACNLLLWQVETKPTLGRDDKMAKTLTIGIKRGFPEESLKKSKEPKVGSDEGGFYVNTITEGIKVYFEEFYSFLERAEKRCLEDLKDLKEKRTSCDPTQEETLAYYWARKIVIEVVLKNIYGYYGDDSNLGVIMSPWCFGTVILEKVEIYKERLSRGELPDVDLPEYPFLVLRYIDEICKKALLDIFNLPPEAFSLKWQYAELLKRFTKVLSDVHSNLSNILLLVKEHHHDPCDHLA